MGFGNAEIKVDGESITVKSVESEIRDLSDDMTKVAARQSWWAQVWAAAEQEKIDVDAAYRAWRAKLVKQQLESEPKMAEWKTKAAIESHPDFMKYKKAISLSVRNTTMLKGHYESFKTKANMAQSIGAMMRSEASATGMTARVGDRKDKQAHSKVDKMRAMRRK